MGGVLPVCTFPAQPLLPLTAHPRHRRHPCNREQNGANATLPGHVITLYNGKTVEVEDTDAEGRLFSRRCTRLSNETPQN